MKTRLLAIAGAMLIAASYPAWPQGYVGVAVGETRMKNACDGAPSSISCDTKDSAIRFFGGYEVAPNAATLKVTCVPEKTVRPTGWLVICGGELILKRKMVPWFAGPPAIVVP